MRRSSVLVYSIPAGVGSAFLAPAVLACAQKWYASRKGLATGVSGAAMGLSGAFLTVFVGFVENRWGMRVCFAALGVVVLAVCGASAAVLQNPPQPAGQPNAKAANDLPPHQMVRTTQYRLCVAGVALAAPPMLLFSPEILTIAANRGLPEQWGDPCAWQWAVRPAQQGGCFAPLPVTTGAANQFCTGCMRPWRRAASGLSLRRGGGCWRLTVC